jgi:Fructose-1-6-bisphosphatase, C-terminal domain
VYPVWVHLCVVARCAQAAAGMGVYGPRTVYVIALKDYPGTHEFLLQDDGKWLHVKETYEIGEPPTPPPPKKPNQTKLLNARGAMLLTCCKVLWCERATCLLGLLAEGGCCRGLWWCAGEGKMFSPGNLRATFDNPAYEKLISYWIGEKYTLRYTGGMVPDVFQILVKEKGVFTNVTSPTTKAKLRILFEVAPLGLLVSAR